MNVFVTQLGKITINVGKHHNKIFVVVVDVVVNNNNNNINNNNLLSILNFIDKMTSLTNS